MRPRALVGVLLALALAAVPRAAAQERLAPAPPPIQHPGLRPPPSEEAAPSPHPRGELDCRACHQGKHAGIVRMYLGIGGRGTPTIPSHMLQVRVECIACHTTPKAENGAEELVGRTFRPSEQACLTCHGDKYKGMLTQWMTTLERMTEVVRPKLAATRTVLEAADRTSPKTTRAHTLVDDADFNLRFVTFAKGVHNVFYAADLLKLSNSWLDEATALLGKPPAKADDTLVRGGYCAALCHKAAGVRALETVIYRGTRVPHARHVAEFGATCTSCHSAETHKTVTATPATCAGCHHSPQNERCEGCHRAQASFYRGETATTLAKVGPNLMASAVSCTGCHDWSHKHSRAAVAQKCTECHDAPYTALLTEWTSGFRADIRATSDAIKAADTALARAGRAHRPIGDAAALLKSARAALTLVTTARPAHNPLAADALLGAARRQAQEARALAGGAR